MSIEESPHSEYDRGFSNGWNAARAQPAQAGALLTDALERELSRVLEGAINMGWISDESRQAIERAVRSKLGAGVGWQPIETKEL